MSRALLYVLFQCVGGFIGALGVLAIHSEKLSKLKVHHEAALIGMFGTIKDPNNSLINSIVDQFIGSMLLMLAIVNIPGSKYKPVFVGCVLGALGLFQGTNGFAFNMARDLFPRIVSTIMYGSSPFEGYETWVWVPVVVPFMGTAFAMLISHFN